MGGETEATQEVHIETAHNHVFYCQRKKENDVGLPAAFQVLCEFLCKKEPKNAFRTLLVRVSEKSTSQPFSFCKEGR